MYDPDDTATLRCILDTAEHICFQADKNVRHFAFNPWFVQSLEDQNYILLCCSVICFKSSFHLPPKDKVLGAVLPFIRLFSLFLKFSTISLKRGSQQIRLWFVDKYFIIWLAQQRNFVERNFQKLGSHSMAVQTLRNDYLMF